MGTRLLIGLLGGGIGASWGPALQEAEAQAQGLCLTYRLVDSEVRPYTAADLPDALAWAVRFGFDGLNVTHPYKLDVVPLLDELTDEARHLGAVNTITIRGGRTLGHNTDWAGFDAALNIDVRGTTVALIGAGGAGLAVAYALLRRGARVLVHDVDAARSAALADHLGDVGDVHAAADPDAALAQASGIVNATPVGMGTDARLPISEQWITAQRWVGDVVYLPPLTPLLALADRRGCRTVTGHAMAAHQHAAAFTLFTGAPADQSRMLAHARVLLRGVTTPTAPTPPAPLR